MGNTELEARSLSNTSKRFSRMMGVCVWDFSFYHFHRVWEASREHTTKNVGNSLCKMQVDWFLSVCRLTSPKLSECGAWFQNLNASMYQVYWFMICVITFQFPMWRINQISTLSSNFMFYLFIHSMYWHCLFTKKYSNTNSVVWVTVHTHNSICTYISAHGCFGIFPMAGPQGQSVEIIMVDLMEAFWEKPKKQERWKKRDKY